jgi:3-methyladenine DNA glycosylase AlkD
MAVSPLIWDRRIAIVATLFFIRNDRFDETLRIAKRLLADCEDLIRKATGWMLREVGKRDMATLERFLYDNMDGMSRITLRYAIERFLKKAQEYLKGPFHIGKKRPEVAD